ncbi:hypothetical protein [Burkholderia pyrrocinia]
MNVVVDYPEDFPLVGVDRKVFDHQLRNLFDQPDPYAAHTLDKLRERIGLKSQYRSGEYDELETLFTLVRTDPDHGVRDHLLASAGDFLQVRLRLAEYRGSCAQENAPALRTPLRWIVAAGTAVFVPVAVAAFVWGGPAVASVVDWIVNPTAGARASMPAVATLAPAASSTVVKITRPTDAPISNVSAVPVDGTTELTLTSWTRDPLTAMDGIKRLMPKNDGSEYQIDVTVSRTSEPLHSPTAGDRQ